MRDFNSQGELATAAGTCSQLYYVRCVLQERVRRAACMLVFYFAVAILKLNSLLKDTLFL